MTPQTDSKDGWDRLDPFLRSAALQVALKARRECPDHRPTPLLIIAQAHRSRVPVRELAGMFGYATYFYGRQRVWVDTLCQGVGFDVLDPHIMDGCEGYEWHRQHLAEVALRQREDAIRR